MVNNRLFFRVLIVLVPLFLASCAMFDQVDIEITSPPNNFRTAEDTPQGIVNLKIDYHGTKQENLANIFLDGTHVGTCLLREGESNMCGQYAIIEHGQHTFTAQVMKDNGSMVTSESTFTWKPYTQMEKVVQFVAGDTGNGLLFVIVIAVVVITIVVVRIAGQVNGWVFAIIAIPVILLIFLAPSMFGPVEAIISLKALQSFLTTTIGKIIAAVVVIVGMKLGYTVIFPTYTKVRAQGDAGMFEGEHIGTGYIGNGHNKNDTVQGLFKSAEQIAHGQQYRIGSENNQLLGPGIRHTRIKHPSFLAKLLFGKKPEIIDD